MSQSVPNLAYHPARAPRPATTWRWRLETNLRALRARAWVRIVGTNRELSWIFFDTVLPLFGIAAYVYFYRSFGGSSATAGFVLLGGAMTAYWMNVLWAMAAQFYWEKEMGNLELFYLAPLSPMSLLIGMSVGGIFQTSVRAFATLLLGKLLFQVTFLVESWLMVALVFALTLSALYGLGMFFSSAYLLWGREAWHVSNMLQEPIYLLSGINFPIKALGRGVALFASLLPLTVGMDAMRQLVLGRAYGVLSPEAELGLLTVLTVVFIALARWGLAKMEHAAKREGRLTLRWQ